MKLTIIAAGLFAASAAQAEYCDYRRADCVYGIQRYRSEEQEMKDRMDRLEDRQRQFENYMRAFEDPPDRR